MPRPSGSPMKGTWRRRYRRLLDLPPGMLRGRLIYRAKLPFFAGGLYDRLLLGRHAPKLTPQPADSWPTDPNKGREIATGVFHLGHQTIREPVPLGRPIGADEDWRVAFNSFAWLGDLMALGAPAELGDLVERRGDEALTAEAGIDAHHQHEVDIVPDMLEGGDRRRRVQRDAGLLAQMLDELQRAVEMRPRLGMDGDDVGARLGEIGDVGIDRRDHQMHVEGKRAVGPQRPHDDRADGQVGDEMPVHHIDMDVVGAGFRHGAHVLAQPGEVGRENRGRDSERASHAPW